MTRSATRDYEIRTGQYPDDLIRADIAACELDDDVQGKLCREGVENEIQNRRNYGIRIEQYPDDLTRADIAACDLDDKLQGELCRQGVENEIEIRIDAIKNILAGKEPNLQNVHPFSKGLHDTMLSLKTMLENAKSNNASHVDKLSIAESELKQAEQGSCEGLTPELKRACVSKKEDAVATKKAIKNALVVAQLLADEEARTAETALDNKLAELQSVQDTLTKEVVGEQPKEEVKVGHIEL
jgi:hypothetical protein